MKKIINILCLSCLLTLAASPLYAQKESGKVFRGNKEYEKQDYTAAEVEYRRGIEANKESFEAHYNLGNALFRQEKYPEAQAAYEQAATLLPKGDNARAAETYHNLGNSYMGQQQYDKAIEAYKEALRNDPKDDDTRYNLAKATQLKKQQQQQKQKQEAEEDENGEDGEKSQKMTQQQASLSEEETDKEPNGYALMPTEEGIDKETAEQILQALEQDEQETQEKLQRQQGTKRRVEKDW